MRRWGSYNFMRIRIQRDDLMNRGDGIHEFLQRPFVIMGAVYRSWYSKDGSAFLVRTNDTVRGVEDSLTVVPAPPGTSHTENGLALKEFIDWHNPLQFNDEQVCVHRLLYIIALTTLLGDVEVCRPDGSGAVQLRTRLATRAAAHSFPG